MFMFFIGGGCCFRGFRKLWWAGLHRRYRFAWTSSRRTGINCHLVLALWTGSIISINTTNRNLFPVLFLHPEKHTSGWAPKFSLFLCLSGVKHLGRYHQHPVSGCVALRGSKLRNGSSCLLHSHQGAETWNDHAKQVQSHMRVNYKKNHWCISVFSL